MITETEINQLCKALYFSLKNNREIRHCGFYAVKPSEQEVIGAFLVLPFSYYTSMPINLGASRISREYTKELDMFIRLRPVSFDS